jgi:hypothetical protein
MVQDDDYGETNIKVLKFIETNENDEISRQKVIQENKETTEKVKEQAGIFELVFEALIDAKEVDKSADDIDRSEHESSLSAGITYC